MNRVRRLAVCCLVLTCLAASIAVAAEPITTYRIDVRLDVEEQTLAGTLHVDYLNDTGGTISEIVFNLLANWGAEPNPYFTPALLDSQYPAGFDPTWTRIDTVRDGAGEPLGYRLEPIPAALQTYSLDDGLLVVSLPASLAPGEQTTVEIDFATHFAAAVLGDMCVHRDTFVWRFGWHPTAIPAHSIEEERFLLPAAIYTVDLTVPSGIAVFGGADRQEVVSSTDEETTIRLESDRPVRSVPLVMGPDLVCHTIASGGIEIDVVGLPKNDAVDRFIASLADDILTYHSAQFGPSAYRRVVIAEDPTPGFYGMAADGFVLVGTSLLREKDMPVLGLYDRLAEYLLAHELAHLWWGIGVGADMNAENWISEGFAEYLSITYFEETYGAFEPNLFSHLEAGLLEEMLSSQIGYMNLRQHMEELPYLALLKYGFDEPIIRPIAESGSLNGVTVRTYNKGYLVLRALDGLIGHDTMLGLLRTLHADYDRGTLTVEALQTAAEEASGLELAWFFESWLHGADRADVAVRGFTSLPTGELMWQTTVDLHAEGAAGPVVIRAVLEDESTLDTTWDPRKTDAPLVLETPGPVVSITVDPDEMTIDSDRFNNHWPRRVLVNHPFSDSEDDPPAGRPLDAYVIDIAATSITGSFRNDHSWGISAIPHLEVDEDTGEFLWDESLRSVDATGVFIAQIDRANTVEVQAFLTDWDPFSARGEVDARADWTHLVFSNPETGTPGTYWYPRSSFRSSLGLIGDASSPIPFAEIAFNLSGLPSHYAAFGARLRTDVPGLGAAGFALTEAAATGRLRFAPGLYVDWTGRIGGSLAGSLPEELAFDLTELYSLEENLAKDARALLRADLVLPPVDRIAGYRVLNLTRIESMTSSVFVQAVAGWAWDETPGLGDVRIEAGISTTLSLAGLLGVPLEVTIGYATPLYGKGLDPDGGAVLGFSLPVTSF